jgi:hypothetical protein
MSARKCAVTDKTAIARAEERCRKARPEKGWHGSWWLAKSYVNDEKYGDLTWTTNGGFHPHIGTEISIVHMENLNNETADFDRANLFAVESPLP